VLQSVLMALDVVLMAAVIPIIQKIESGKDRILKVLTPFPDHLLQPLPLLSS